MSKYVQPGEVFFSGLQLFREQSRHLDNFFDFAIIGAKLSGTFVHLDLTIRGCMIKIDSVWCTLPQCFSWGTAFH